MYSIEERNRIYDEWFEKGKYIRKEFFKRHGFVFGNELSIDYQKHIEWKVKTQMNATPTILFSGYELPKIYLHQIDRLSFFTELNIEL